MMRNIQNRKTGLTALLVFFILSAQAQPAIDSARVAAVRFFRTYDSLQYLTFDTRFSYSSDTVYSDYTNEVMTGTYTMSGARVKYTLGKIDYLQNDSFHIAVYHDDQVIVVAPRNNANGGSFVPMRDALDSLLLAESAHYDFQTKTTGASESSELEDTDNGYIRLTRKTNDTLAQFNRYVITYQISTNLITTVEYEFTEPGHSLSSVDEPNEAVRILKNTARKRRLKIEFTNYRFANFSDDAYSENNYVWNDDGEYKPVDKYKNYTVYNAR
jgi:hypothetical protein